MLTIRKFGVFLILTLLLFTNSLPAEAFSFSFLGQENGQAVIRDRLKLRMANMSDDMLVDVILKFEGELKTDLRNYLNEEGTVTYEYKLIDAAAVRLPKRIVEKLADEEDRISWMDDDFKLKTLLDSAVPQIEANKVYDSYGLSGAGVKVAVLDTGVDKSHPALSKDVIKQIDFTGEGNGDKNGHGTHVAGIITGDLEPYQGVAREADILDVKVLDGTGFGELSDILAGIEWAVAERADVISMSLGARVDQCDGSDPIALMVDSAYDQGVFVVVAAGNDGPLAGTINTPGCAKKVLTVGAVNDLDQVAFFSSRGPTADGRVKPDIFAPGVSITSTYPDNKYAVLSGTSQATPIVAGVVALLLEARGNVTNEQLKTALLSTVDPLPRAFMNTQDQGVVNAFAAVFDLAGEPEEKPENDGGQPEKDQGNETPENQPADDEVENVSVAGGFEAQFDQAREELSICLGAAGGDVERKNACLSEFMARQKEIQFGRFSDNDQAILLDLREQAESLALEISKNGSLSSATVERALNYLEDVAYYLFDANSAIIVKQTLQANATVFSDGTDNELLNLLDDLEFQYFNLVQAAREEKFADGFLDFKDSDDDEWFFVFVHFLKNNGCVGGFETDEGQPTGEFRPANSITVAEALKIVLECAGFEESENGTSAVLKADGHWSEGYWVTAGGLELTIASDKNEDPDRPITRAETVVMIFETFDVQPIANVEHVFEDVPPDLPEADYIESARVYQIVSGDSGTNTFRPFDTLNRAEMSKVIIQALDVFATEEAS